MNTLSNEEHSTAINIESIFEPRPESIFEPREDIRIPCKYFRLGSCRFANRCRNLHINDAKQFTCIEKSLSPPPTQEECGICMTAPLEGDLYAILSGCSCVFCINCIRTWRQGSARADIGNEQVRRCPLCRQESFFAIPNAKHLKHDSAEKAQLIGKYKENCKSIPCKFYLENGDCKFGRNCFYRHVDMHGRVETEEEAVVAEEKRLARRKLQSVESATLSQIANRRVLRVLEEIFINMNAPSGDDAEFGPIMITGRPHSRSPSDSPHLGRMRSSDGSMDSSCTLAKSHYDSETDEAEIDEIAHAVSEVSVREREMRFGDVNESLSTSRQRSPSSRHVLPSHDGSGGLYFRYHRNHPQAPLNPFAAARQYSSSF